MHRVRTLLLAVAAAASVVASGAGNGIVAAAEPSDAPASMEAGADDAVILAQAEALAAMDDGDRNAVLAAMGAELELDVAELSGLAEALGGRDAARAALVAAWAPVITKVTDVLGPDAPPFVLASSVMAATDGPNIGAGMFGGYMLVSLGAGGVVIASNDLPDGKPVRGRQGELDLDLSRESATAVMDAGNESNGVTTKLHSTVRVAPCPAPDGTFEATATIDVSATRGSVGQHGTLEVKVTGHVDDDARLASSDTEYRMQWAKSGGSNEQVVDVSGTRNASGSDVTLHRAAGAGAADLVTEATSLGMLYTAMIDHFITDAAKMGWESGRCVRLAVSSAAR